MTNKTLPVNNEALPSGISHGFDTGYAIAYGVDEAIMIKNLQFFIQSNANRGHNFHQGRFWTYDRLQDLPNHFPYWTIKQIRRILKSLIDQKVIMRDEFNKVWSERTSWYAFINQEKFVPNIKPPKVATPVPESESYTPEIQINSLVMPKRATERCPNGQLTNVQMGNCTLSASTITSTITSSLSPPEPVPAVAVEKEKVDSFGSHVKLTATQMKELQDKHGEKRIADFIDRVNDYCASKGKTYKDWAAAIRNFIRNDDLKNPASVEFDSNAALKRRQSSKMATPGDFEKDGYKRKRII